MWDSGRVWIVVAAVLGALAVALGAFGAHALRGRVAPETLHAWNTAVQYHLMHSVALLGLALYAAHGGRGALLPALLWTAGIALFSGSLYALGLGGPRWLGPVTPVGGLCLIAGWLALLGVARG